MIAAGVNVKALTFMGHANIKITPDQYGHLLPGAEDEAAGPLDAFLASAAAVHIPSGASCVDDALVPWIPASGSGTQRRRALPDILRTLQGKCCRGTPQSRSGWLPAWRREYLRGCPPPRPQCRSSTARCSADRCDAISAPFRPWARRSAYRRRRASRRDRRWTAPWGRPPRGIAHRRLDRLPRGRCRLSRADHSLRRCLRAFARPRDWAHTWIRREVAIAAQIERTAPMFAPTSTIIASTGGHAPSCSYQRSMKTSCSISTELSHSPW